MADEQLSSTNQRAPSFERTADEERDYALAIEEFRATPGVWFGGDLLVDALSRGDEETARDVAVVVLAAGDQASRPLREIASAVVSGAVPEKQTSGQDSVKMLRSRLRHFDKNPVAWVDFAFHLNLAGKFKEAHRAIATALKLAPENRFVLRSASRFYLNRGEQDRAHAVLRNAATTPHDPWLVAAEIAVATAIGKGSRLWKAGRSMVKDHKFSPLHVSELASAVGTAELNAHGTLRQIRTMFTASLEDPTANSIAQAEWAYRNHNEIGVRPDLAGRKDIAEARAWEAFLEGKFDDALRFAQAWLSDEPFSSRPANLISWLLTSIYEDYAGAVALLSKAIIPNPTNAIILNNLAFALANLNEVKKARTYVDRASSCTDSEEDKVVVMATRGLIAFREKRYKEGMRLYLEAINRSAASNSVDERIPTVASLYLAREMVMARLEDADLVARNALNAARRSSSAHVRELAKTLEPTLSADAHRDASTHRFGRRLMRLLK
jgi:tetratricopeptide (TPR) repeat protein